MRFSSAARSRTRSPITRSGKSSAIAISAARPLASARAVSVAPIASASARGRNGSSPSTSPRLSARTPSTTSVARAARCSAAPFTRLAHCRSRSGKSAAAINSLSARMPLSGVRISCASIASAVSIASDRPARRGRATFRRLPAALALPTLRMAGPSPHTECHGWPEQANHGSRPCRFLGRTVSRSRQAQASPTMRRISAGVLPCWRNSRSAVARVDFDSLCPSASRIRR